MDITLYNDECLCVMANNIFDNSVDLILADLPYGTTQCKWDIVIPFDALWSKYKRIIKPNGAILLHAAQPFSALMIASNINNWKQSLVWKKNVASNFLNAKRQHLLIHEDVNLFSYGTPVYNPQMRYGKPYNMKRTGRDDSGDCYGQVSIRTDTVNTGERYPQTVLEFDREVGLHPTQKPISLARYLIRTYSNEGDIVLDNTMGSGTTGVAAVQEGRGFIGIERDEQYFSLAKRRIECK